MAFCDKESIKVAWLRVFGSMVGSVAGFKLVFFAAVHLGQLHIRQTGGDFVDKTEIQNHANKADSLFGPAPYQIDFRSITKTFQAIGTVCVCAFVLVI